MHRWIKEALSLERTRRKRLERFQSSLLTHYPTYPKQTHDDDDDNDDDEPSTTRRSRDRNRNRNRHRHSSRHGHSYSVQQQQSQEQQQRNANHHSNNKHRNAQKTHCKDLAETVVTQRCRCLRAQFPQGRAEVGALSRWSGWRIRGFYEPNSGAGPRTNNNHNKQ